ncbi:MULTISPECIES: hypothetical protein [unclassified Microbacterium]|uniref:hypothetical protein n=1 Tax=unclassified Microbacterium TaxID=2609290 RepID=UPI00109CC179|nr:MULTISPECIES: hypothetical protein [unclassified Microbacterium]
MSPAKGLRSAGAVLGISLLVAVGLVPTVPSTEAAWTDAERATATGTSINIPEPIASGSPGCVASSGLLGANPRVTISWRAPAAATGYDLTKAEFGQIANQGLLEPILSNLLGNVQTSGNAAAYVTVIDGGLLTGLLGATKTFGIRFIGPGGWRSDWLVANASMGLLGANPQCAMATARSY